LHRNKITDAVPFSAQLAWYNLAFTAGMINSGGFLACRRFVSHVTGFVTLSGVDFVQHSWREGLSALSIPAFFTLGAMTSAWFTEPRPGDSAPRSLTPALAIVAAIMAATILLGRLGYLGPFGVTEEIMQDYFMLALLSLACGIQNAAATSATSSSIRPTHLTGTATDLGIGIIRATIQPRASADRKRELMVTRRRLGLILAFICGAIAGAWIFSLTEYNGFYLPLLTSIFAVGLSMQKTF